MRKSFFVLKSVFLALFFVMTGVLHVHAEGIPAPVYDSPLLAAHGEDHIILAGGCFWGVQAVFQHVHGVKSAISGYAGGDADTASYRQVSAGNTGHAEAVRVVYDPAVISLGTILRIYFSVAHNPTELNRQGPDRGTQYRSAVFYETPEQKKITQNYIDQLDKAKIFSGAIVTSLEKATDFYQAEDYHQDYARLHPDDPYIAIHDLPKVAHLQKEFPALFQAHND